MAWEKRLQQSVIQGMDESEKSDSASSSGRRLIVSTPTALGLNQFRKVARVSLYNASLIPAACLPLTYNTPSTSKSSPVSSTTQTSPA
jgi:hypothetical protein